MAIKEENTTAARGDQEEHMDVDSASEVEEMEEEASEEEAEEEPDVTAAADKLEIVGAHGDPTALTFCFKEEDHTLGNSLRHIVNKNPNVDFCGYSLPHPSEAKMHFRIQTTDKTTAIDALKTGLQNLYDVVAHVRSAYAEDLAKKEYVEFEETA
ncbi:RBP11-like subunits of RNA polymerase [Rhizopus microsporus ATCC 52813]|uniref:DNA-directed RNA polymerases I and III subunit RPAC2 n=1 Tax=Rhizopus microsporus ATCC 52813 TaxID=1340429 RepID=A0A2G4SRG5_RHIZD|nr:RBP11-like subunits of RNA polymerase [Rhizopus microsporus ATCC 52813]PHZ11369.1 RBP11-like subunits of RNA polymerase [Rhizopus microsporus ATCC 52813]